MYFASDNAGPAHPKVMQAVLDANEGYAGSYGADDIMERVRNRLREIFEAPDAVVYLVATGTAANALALGCYTQPWQTIFCTKVSHINEDECNAPEFYAGGAKLTLVPGGDKMEPTALREAIAYEEARGVHGPQRGPVSITQVTERGGVHDLEHRRSLGAVSGEFGLPVHMDGARFANALVALGCSPAEMTWKAGVDVLSFGGTKNGCLGVEAVIFFDPSKAWEFELRRKRGAHLFSKHRYLSAQMAAYLEDNLWLDLAKRANDTAARLAKGLTAQGAKLLHPLEANMVFAALPRQVHQHLMDEGAMYYLWGATLKGDDPNEMLPARFVCDWSIAPHLVDQFLGVLQSTTASA